VILKDFGRGFKRGAQDGLRVSMLLILFGVGFERGFAAPVNDLCAGAESIPGSGPFPYFSSITADVSTATTTGDPAAPACSSAGASHSIWYRFTPTATALYTLSVSEDTATTVPDTVMAVYSSPGGCAGPFSVISCNDDAGSLRSAISANLNAGTSYFILVWVSPFSSSLTNGHGAVQLKVSKPVAPANDGCSGAEVIPPNGPFPYLTAITDNTLAGSAGDPPAPQCQALYSRSVWYKFTPGAATTYTLSTCADTATTVYDTVMAIYTSAGACAGPFTLVACNDDSCGARASITTGLAAGTTYYIVIWESQADPYVPGETSVQLRISGLFPPTVATLPAASISSTGAMARATVNPNGAATTAWFDWGTTTNYTISTPAQSLGNGSSSVAVSASLNGLSNNQTYFYRIRATNVLGASAGTNLSFAWSAAAPRITNAGAGAGNFNFQFSGTSRQTYLIQFSTNLSTWATLGNAADNGNNTFSFQDPFPTNTPKRFFRVLLP
jgi:hypothetical protein